MGSLADAALPHDLLSSGGSKKACLTNTWTSKMPKIMDPALPVFSIWGYWAKLMGTLEVQVHVDSIVQALAAALAEIVVCFSAPTPT